MNAWLSAYMPFFLGYLSENPLGFYRFRLITYNITDYGSGNHITVLDEVGSLRDGVMLAMDLHSTDRLFDQAFMFEPDPGGRILFSLYLLSLAVNAGLILVLLVLFIHNALKGCFSNPRR